MGLGEHMGHSMAEAVMAIPDESNVRIVVEKNGKEFRSFYECRTCYVPLYQIGVFLECDDCGWSISSEAAEKLSRDAQRASATLFRRGSRWQRLLGWLRRLAGR